MRWDDVIGSFIELSNEPIILLTRSCPHRAGSTKKAKLGAVENMKTNFEHERVDENFNN